MTNTRSSPDTAALCPFCKKPPGQKVGPPAMARCVTPGCKGISLAAVTLAEWNAAPMTAPTSREEPLAYRLDHPKHGIELTIYQPDDDWLIRGWKVTPLYARAGVAQCPAPNDLLWEAMEALKPFIQTGWMTSDTEHTARTVVAHMHPESEREIILSSENFRNAAKVYAALAALPSGSQAAGEAREKEITRLATIEECAQIADGTHSRGGYIAAARIRALSPVSSTDQREGGK